MVWLLNWFICSLVPLKTSKSTESEMKIILESLFPPGCSCMFPPGYISLMRPCAKSSSNMEFSFCWFARPPLPTTIIVMLPFIVTWWWLGWRELWWWWGPTTPPMRSSSMFRKADSSMWGIECCPTLGSSWNISISWFSWRPWFCCARPPQCGSGRKKHDCPRLAESMGFSKSYLNRGLNRLIPEFMKKGSSL